MSEKQLYMCVAITNGNTLYSGPYTQKRAMERAGEMLMYGHVVQVVTCEVSYADWNDIRK